MKKALIILRVSDQMQEERNSLEKQEEQAVAYCKFKDYSVYKIIKTVVSGRKNNRTDFMELEDEIERNNFDVLVFYELSRLARNAYFIHKLVHSLRQKEIAFESITESYLNSDSPTSKMMLGIMASQAEIESDMTSKRVRNRMKFYASQGYFLFPPPLGYRLEDKILYPIEEEAAKVKSIFSDFVSGYSIKKLGDKHNKAANSIKKILTNVTYLGKVKFGFEGMNQNTGKRVVGLEGEIFEGKHEAIIDEKTFELAQTILKSRSRKITREVREENILTGILVHYDGSRMYGKRYPTRNKKGFYRLYYCRHCNKSIASHRIEKVVLDTIKEYSKTLKFLDIKPVKKKKNYDKEIRKLNAKKERIVETYADGFLSREKYLEQAKKIDEKILEIKATANEIPNDTATLKEKLLQDIKNIDKKENFEKKNIIRLFIEEIVFTKEGGVDITFKF